MAFKPIRVRDLARLQVPRIAASRRIRLGGLLATTLSFAPGAAAIQASPLESDVAEAGAIDSWLDPILLELETDAPTGTAIVKLIDEGPMRLRAVVEAARRPLGRSALTLIDGLRSRPDSASRELSIEFTARLPNEEANRRLAATLDSFDPLDSPRVVRALKALAPIASFESVDAIARHLRSPSRECRTAARAAGSALARELLAEARLDDALAALDRFTEEDPGRLEFEISRAIARGVYAGDAAPARRDLLAVPVAASQSGALAADRVEIEIAAAAVAFFSGDEHGAFAELDLARSRLRDASDRKIASALTAGRAEFVVAVASLAATRPDEAAARAAIRRAIETRPHDDGVYLGDNSLYGPAGARAWLEHLRRSGRPEVRRAFYRLLREELAASEPPVAADDEIPARSWAPVWQVYALLDDGLTSEAIGIVSDTATRLEKATAWTDRWMVAELEFAHAIAEHLEGDSAAALTRIASIERRVVELAAAEVDQLAFESREIVPSPGSPPLRDSLRDLRARVERLAAEASFVAGRPADALRRARLAIAADPFDDAGVALELAAALRQGESEQRARRAFECLPRPAGALLDLSRLAFALGLATEGEELFARHVAWNALTEERRALELARKGRDPSLAPR